MTAAVLAVRTTLVLHRFPLSLLGAGLALVAAIGFAVSVGAVAIPVGTVWAIALDQLWPGLVHADWSAGRANIVWEIRFPRALLAAVVGAGLALVGTALQAVTRNPLADPHLLGVSSGACCGAIVALLHTGLFLGLVTLPLFAFAGALVATGLVLALTTATAARSADRLVLVGVAVSFVIMAAANILIFLGDPRAAHTVVFWMLGGLGMAEWSHLAWPVGALLLGGGWLMANARLLTAMTVGDETAAALGIEVERFRRAVFVATAFLTGAMVAFSGAIGFVGLMVPHVVRLVVGGSVERMVPLAALVGAIFLVLADAAARLLAAPEDMPIGIVTGVVGGLFFLAMMARTRR
ncbi:FecCD family ABC transporter permease [Mongoliimonas terrestris]|uniref:FecCD family ABC transporter permease n=1 Tax=Mongoliimonas terrestris TaxID=1709001 RepID=UPI000949AFD9|nr:iron ABC transporter permease [Mongoliimonas terrestris]